MTHSVAFLTSRRQYIDIECSTVRLILIHISERVYSFVLYIQNANDSQVQKSLFFQRITHS
jgi:hypothetical protein